MTLFSGKICCGSEIRLEGFLHLPHLLYRRGRKRERDNDMETGFIHGFCWDKHQYYGFRLLVQL